MHSISPLAVDSYGPMVPFPLVLAVWSPWSLDLAVILALGRKLNGR